MLRIGPDRLGDPLATLELRPDGGERLVASARALEQSAAVEGEVRQHADLPLLGERQESLFGATVAQGVVEAGEVDRGPSPTEGEAPRDGPCQLQLTVGMKTWLYKLPKLPPILVPPPEAQIPPFTKADP